MSRPKTDLAAAFRDHWKRYFAFPDGTPIVVAVSGGIDSMTLLALLCRERICAPKTVVAAHFDHRLRGAASAADGRFVAAVAARWGAAAVLGDGDAREAATVGRAGPQAAARELRYSFLAEVARAREAGAIVTAHHRDDRVETVLLRLVRGTSPAGLAALRPIDVVAGAVVVRPLLAFARRDVELWAERTGVPFRDDPSNRDRRYARTRVRGEVLPLLRELNPRVDEAVVRLSALAGADAAYLDRVAGDLVDAATLDRRPEVWCLAADRVRGVPTPLLSRLLLRGWAWSATAGSPPPSAEWVAGAVSFVQAGRGGEVPLPGGGCLRRAGGDLEFVREG